jgi:hypothetical protein
MIQKRHLERLAAPFWQGLVPASITPKTADLAQIDCVRVASLLFLWGNTAVNMGFMGGLRCPEVIRGLAQAVAVPAA